MTFAPLVFQNFNVPDLNKNRAPCPNCYCYLETVFLEDFKKYLSPTERCHLEQTELRNCDWLESNVCWNCYIGLNCVSYLELKSMSCERLPQETLKCKIPETNVSFKNIHEK